MKGRAECSQTGKRGSQYKDVMLRKFLQVGGSSLPGLKQAGTWGLGPFGAVAALFAPKQTSP